MRRSFCRSVVAAVTASLAFAGAVVAQSTITQWNFNSGITAPSTGNGTLTLLAGVTSASVSGNGSSDTGSSNMALNTATYPAATVGSGTAGVQFAVSTANFTDINVSMDMRWSTSASRFIQLQYSTNGGTTFVDGPSGLVTSPGTANFVNTVNGGFNLTGLAGVANNANFRFRMVTVFDPAGSAYVGNSAPYAVTGTVRYDMVTVAGTALVSLPPTGSGSALPAGVCRGSGSVNLQVATSPGQIPTSGTINVVGNLTSIGGPANAAFVDQGGGVFVFTQAISNAVTLGTKTINFTVSDELSRSSNGSLQFVVADCLPATGVLISQVYGGGGNFGPPVSTFTNDFVELFNKSNAPVDVTGWSIQYASAGGAFNQKVDLTGVIPAGRYFLIQMAQGTSGNQPLPTPDTMGTIALGLAAGKVALVNNNVLIQTLCVGSTVVDLVAYGSGVSCREGDLAAPPTTNETAILRFNSGCQDTNQNLDDFFAGSPTPRNSSSPANSCNGTGPVIGDGNVSVTTTGCAGDAISFTVSGIGQGTPASAITAVTIDLTSIGGSVTNMVQTPPNSGIYIASSTLPLNSVIGNRLFGVTASDALGRTGSANGLATVLRCQPSAGQSLDPRGVCSTGGSVRILVFPTLATSNPPSTGIASVVANFGAVDGPTAVELAQESNGTAWIAEGIAIPGVLAGSYNVAYLLTDLEGRTFAGSATLLVVDCVAAPAGVRISQVFGGGGNSTTSGGAPFQNDYVELFNNSEAAVNMAGWSLQVASTTGNFANKVDLTGMIQPGGYYLIQLQAGIGCNGSPCGEPLPTADQSDPARFLGTSAGKVALVNDGTLVQANFTAASIVDLIGYGGAANGFEGVSPSAAPNDVRALFRDGNGCVDNNQNGADLRTAVASPRNSASATNSCGDICFVDFNADGFFNQEDLSGFLSTFLDESVPPGPSGTNTFPCPGEPAPYDTLGYAADFNRDCSFNQEDLSGFVTEYFLQAENPTTCIPG